MRERDEDFAVAKVVPLKIVAMVCRTVGAYSTFLHYHYYSTNHSPQTHYFRTGLKVAASVAFLIVL